MDYYEIPDALKYRLHALELREAYYHINAINQDKHFTLSRLNRLLFGAEFHPWTEAVNEFITASRSKRQRRVDLIPYYLVAGVGIIRICELLKVGTARVYSVKNSLPSYDRANPITGAFLDYPKAIENLQHVLDQLNITDGFRITKPERERHNPFEDED